MEQLNIENFKCFYKASIPLNKLTLFAGANGNGKSTAIQALLFLRRTIEHCAKWEDNKYNFAKPNGLNVELNGAYCLALGNSSYVLPKNTNKNTILLGTSGDDRNEFSVEYEANGTELWLTPKNVVNKSLNRFSLFNHEFYYLNAERIGPRLSQSIKFFDFPNAGFQGEYVAQLLSDTQTNYKFEVSENRRSKNSKSPRLEQQVNAWLDELMPGVSVTASYHPDTHSAQIRVDNYFTKGDPAVATNIGFGISYVLPIIVTGLIAKNESFMIVENPEAHLHPSAQSKIGRFLSMVASSGVKVIIETHSDHVVHGIQISTALGEIKTNQVTINYFDQDSEAQEPTQPLVKTLTINDKGELSSWPNGFFDQSQRDFAELLKIRKG